MGDGHITAGRLLILYGMLSISMACLCILGPFLFFVDKVICTLAKNRDALQIQVKHEHSSCLKKKISYCHISQTIIYARPVANDLSLH